MGWHRSGRELWVELLGDFNYERVLKLKEIMKEDDILILNLQNCSFVDTEAVDFLYSLYRESLIFLFKIAECSTYT